MRTARCVAVALLLPGPCLSLRIGDDDASVAQLTLSDSLSGAQHSKTATLHGDCPGSREHRDGEGPVSRAGSEARSGAGPGEAAASSTDAPSAAEVAVKKATEGETQKKASDEATTAAARETPAAQVAVKKATEGETQKKASDEATTAAARETPAAQQPADDSAAIEEYLDGLLDKHKTAVVEVPQEPLVIVEPDAKDGYTARTLSDDPAAVSTDGAKTSDSTDQPSRPKAAAFWMNNSTAAFANAQDLKDKLHKWISDAKDATVAELAPEVAAKASAVDLVATLAAGNEGAAQQPQGTEGAAQQPQTRDLSDIIREEEAVAEVEETKKSPIGQAATARQNAEYESVERQALPSSDWKEEMYGIWAFCAALGLSIGSVLCFDSMGKAFPHPLYGPEEALCLTAAARAENRGGIDGETQYDDGPRKAKSIKKAEESRSSSKRIPMEAVKEEPIGRPSREAQEVDQVLTVKQGKKSGFVSEVAQVFTFVASSGRGGKPQGGKGTRRP